MKIPKIITNRFTQFASLTVLVFFAMASVTSAYTICPPVPKYCVLTSSDRPEKELYYNKIIAMGNIVCTGTSRIALVLTLQKRNSLGQWVDVKTTSGFGNTTAYVENSKSCTNTKITTWRSVILVVGNGGAWTFQKTSPSTYTAYCGT